jgi:hypothetical protein
MSTNTINYEKNKMIFSQLIGTNYKIIKNSNDKHILTIESAEKEIKCKYILLMFERKYKNKSQIVWADYNPFIDQYTRSVSIIIRNSMKNNYTYLSNDNNQFISDSDLKNFIKNLIKNQYNFLDNQGQSINCNWILTNEITVKTNTDTHTVVEYYMITDIIYY